MRLTSKINGEYALICPDVNWGNNIPDVREHANKLGQLEDIEDELGIDLITLFKALKNGVWFINPTNGKKAYSKDFLPSMSFDEKGISIYISMYFDLLLCFNDYGKTWALTKEELE